MINDDFANVCALAGVLLRLSTTYLQSAHYRGVQKYWEREICTFHSINHLLTAMRVDQAKDMSNSKQLVAYVKSVKYVCITAKSITIYCGDVQGKSISTNTG